MDFSYQKRKEMPLEIGVFIGNWYYCMIQLYTEAEMVCLQTITQQYDTEPFDLP
jgi:hypothetical protein